MSETEYDAAVAEFIRKKGVTRCPTACVAPTNATVAETERAALRTHEGAREAARLEKLNSVQQRGFSFPGDPRYPDPISKGWWIGGLTALSGPAGRLGFPLPRRAATDRGKVKRG